jgi:microcystin-dependent protein
MDPFLGEIRIFGFGFAPRGWALCQGQVLAINQNQALFALLGTMYGGNGQTTFALPDLRGRAPIHFANNHAQGESAGVEQVTLLTTQIPSHNHLANCNGTGSNAVASPGGTYWSKDTAGNLPYSNAGGGSMAPQAISLAGGSQPHDNMMPTLVINYCIALQGIFPSRS